MVMQKFFGEKSRWPHKMRSGTDKKKFANGWQCYQIVRYTLKTIQQSINQ